jgi:hypothetical protein
MCIGDFSKFLIFSHIRGVRRDAVRPLGATGEEKRRVKGLDVFFGNLGILLNLFLLMNRSTASKLAGYTTDRLYSNVPGGMICLLLTRSKS